MAVRTVSNTGGNWNATATWVGGVVPLAGDDVNFTATSGPLTVNVSTANLIGINFTNYVNTITFNQPINTNGTVNLGTNGYTQNGTSGLIINGATTISGITIWSRTISFTGTTYVVTLSNTLNITGQVTFSQTGTLSFLIGANTFNPTGVVLIANGTTTLPNNINITNLNIIPSTTSTPVFNSNTINISENLTLNSSVSGMTFSGTTNLILTGTGTWTGSSTNIQLRNNLTINTVGTITISGIVYYNTGTLTYTAGTVVTTGSTLNCALSTTFNCSNMNGVITNKWNNVTFSAGTQTLSSNLNIGGNLTTQTSAIVINGLFNVNVGGNLAINIGTSGTSTIVLNNTGTWSTTNYLSNNLTINTSGNITIGANIYYNTGTLLYTAGIVNTTTNNSTLNINASTTLSTGTIAWNNITVTAAATITLGANLKVSSAFTMTTGGYAVTITPGVFSVDFSTANITIGNSNLGATTFTYNGTITCVNFAVVAGNGTSGTLNGTTYNITGNFTITTFGTGGSVAGTSTINLTGTGTVQQTNSGIYAVPVTNNFTINTTGTITFLSGTRFFYQTGIFTYTAGTVITTNVIFGILGSCTLNTDRGITQINWANVTSFATATITLSSNLNTTNLIVSSGTLSFTLGGNNLLISGDLTINSTLNTPQNLQVVNLILGNSAINGLFTISASGNLTQSNSAIINGTTTIQLNGTGIWNNVSTGALATNLIINTTGVVTISGTVYYQTGTLTYIANTGSVITTGSTLNIPTTTTLNTNTLPWNNIITTQSNFTITLLSNLTINGTFNPTTLGALTINGLFNILINGNFTNAVQTAILGTSSVIFGGTGTWSNVTFTGYLGLSATINTIGTLTISGSVYYATGTLLYTSGTVITISSTLNISASSTLNTNILNWNNIIISGGTQTLTSNLNISGNLTTQTSTVTINGLFNVNVSGNLAINIATSGTATIRLINTSTWSHGAAVYLSNSLIINTVGIITISGSVYYNTGTLTYTSGTVNVTGSTLFIGASPTISTPNLIWNNVTFATLGNYAFTITSNLLVGGTFTIGGGGTINGLFNIYCGALAVNNSTSGAGSVPVTLFGVIYCSGNCTLSGTAILSLIFIGCIVYVGGNLSFTSLTANNQGATEFVMTGTGTLSQLSNISSINAKITFNKSSNITITTDLYFYPMAITMINLGGKINATKSTLYIGTTSITSTLIGMNTVNWKAVQIASGSTLLINEFFNGSPGVVTIVKPSSTTNYTITFQDGFEKITKFTNISGCTLAKPMQLLSLNNMTTKSTNRGIRYINQSPNGVAKGKSSVNVPMTFGTSTLINDPNM